MKKNSFSRPAPKAPGSELYLDFQRRADAFVAENMANFKPRTITGTKVIHDCVWGTVMFYPWELELIDSPLLQRLRRINQLGLAQLTYPSAHHSRFEHTLGVVAVVAQMIAGVARHDAAVMAGKEQTIPASHQRRLRLAALLHDVGHCFFSHLSETIYGEMPAMKELKATEPMFERAQPHEMLGYIIINTPTFVKCFSESLGYPFEEGEDAAELLGEVGRMIVGAAPEVKDGVRYVYLTEMINGQFDADALDYLRRDSYATGLALGYHIDRFLYKLRLADRVSDDGIVERHLTVPVSGLSTVEEMVFSKLMLSRYIYQHQKVLAAESLIEDMVVGMQRSGRFSHPIDFLYLCDNDIYSIGAPSADKALRPAITDWKLSDESDVTVGDMAARVLARRLPKKALVISQSNVHSAGGINSRDLGISGLAAAVSLLPRLREEILDQSRIYAEALGMQRPEMYDIHIAIPHISMAKDYSRTPVLTYDGEFIPMSEAVNLNDWTRSFAGQSWNAYIFSEPEILPAVSLAAYTVLERNGIRCNREMLFSSLKESDAIEAAAEKLGLN
ncbi:MAG: HD domain-containing protein [Clostridia bacterium]|nr:HD domain-containing protein [Clostridia bacterium]